MRFDVPAYGAHPILGQVFKRDARGDRMIGIVYMLGPNGWVVIVRLAILIYTPPFLQLSGGYSGVGLIGNTRRKEGHKSANPSGKPAPRYHAFMN